MNIDTKELAIVKTQVSKAVATAQELQIKEKADLVLATDILSKIKSVGKIIQEKKEGITKPLNEALKNARDLFRPIEAQWQEAETIVKQKMVAYQIVEEKKVEKKEEKIAEKVDSGKMSFEKAAEKIEKIEKVENKIEGKTGEIQFKTIKKVIIEDATKLPREYLIPDDVKIRKDALTGIEISGVKVIEEKIVASK